MKLTTVISSVNSNPDYYNFLPYQIIFWNKFGIKFICVYVGEKIPDELEQYKEHIILWDKNQDLHSAYVAQNIRIYYAGLIDLPEDEYIMLTDMDMLPCSESYYKNGLEKYTKEDFIYYRYIDSVDKHIYICYNSAHPSLWANIFNIGSTDDIEKELNLNYCNGYNGIPGDHPGSVGWCTDQDLLTKKLQNYNKLHILNRPIKRLEVRDYIRYLQNGTNDFLHLYDDVHFHRSFSKNKQLIEHAVVQLNNYNNFISGYEFHKICKWSLCPRYPVKFEPNAIQSNDMVFLNFDHFTQLIQMLKQTPPSNKFILLTHNSDQKFTSTHLETIRPYVSHIYAINCGVQDPLITPIPLGFVDSKYKPHAKFEEIKLKNLEKTILCYMNFAINTNPVKRQECWDSFVNKDWVTYQSNIPPEEFYTQVARSKYVLSPEGTGIDCHRIYESIYLGSIPILKTSELDYFYKSLPVLIVDSWEQITEEFLEEKYLENKSKLNQWVQTNPEWVRAKYWLREKNSCGSCGYLCGGMKCGKCMGVTYCNRTCQLAHWTKHKNECNGTLICSFTQTYSNNRSELFTYHNKDNTDIYFRNKLNKNYYVFHNSEQNYIKEICNGKYLKSLNKTEIITYNNISYTETLLKTLKKCKMDGVKYLFFLQDDVFCAVKNKIIDELLDFIKYNKFDMLNIEADNINPEAKILYSSDNLKIYDTTSDDFKNKKLWAFDDGPYVANVDFLLNILYDKMYFSKNDIWSAEQYLNDKITNNKIQRLTCNVSLFKRIGIVGPNAWNRVNELKLLNEMFI